MYFSANRDIVLLVNAVYEWRSHTYEHTGSTRLSVFYNFSIALYYYSIYYL
jgi:hypothetical protein